MKKSKFLVGMGVGVTVGSLAGMAMSGPGNKRSPKNVVGKTLKTMGEVVDAVSSSMGM